MTETVDIINTVAIMMVITKKDMMVTMVGTVSIINRMGLLTGITKSGMDIIIAGTKDIISAGIATTTDIGIGRSTIIIIIITIIIGHIGMKGLLSDSS
jgi:hypothetical protein